MINIIYLHPCALESGSEVKQTNFINVSNGEYNRFVVTLYKGEIPHIENDKCTNKTRALITPHRLKLFHKKGRANAVLHID